MSNEDRRRIIINYIRNHPDCKAQEIVEGVYDKMCRTLVFRYLPELINEKVILDNSKNRRDHKFSINNNNLILEVQDEIDNFKKVFFHLIQKTEIIAKNKDYAIISKEIGLSTEEPKKWTNEDYKKYVSSILELKKKGKDILSNKYPSVLDEFKTQIEDLSKALDSYPNNTLNDINKIISIVDKLVESCNQRIAIIDDILFTYNKFVSIYDIFIIVNNMISIFQYIFNLFFYRSIIWSGIISKEMLLKLNDFIFNSFIDIQNRLTKSISHIYSLFNLTNIVDIILQELKLNKKNDVFADDPDGLFLYNYKVMGLENEITNVIASILPMCRETEKYGISPRKIINQNTDFFEKEKVTNYLAFLKNIQQQFKSLKQEQNKTI